MLLSRPEPQPLPAPPFCGMQVTPALLKGLYSEPALEAGAKKPEKVLLATNGAEPGTRGMWLRQKPLLASCLCSLSHQDWPWRSNPEFLCWSEQEIPVSSWERPTRGDIITSISRDTGSYQSLILALGSDCSLPPSPLCLSQADPASLPHPENDVRFSAVTQGARRSEMINSK